MEVDVVFLPGDLISGDLADRAVVVFDVLRATTTMAAALAAGVRDIRVFDSTAGALEAATAFGENRILCGEERCLPPRGFDLGNSPGAFSSELHAGRSVFMSTTNGTRALLAAREARALFAGALVNAQATARHLSRLGMDATLLCAGTNGQVAMEDLLGAGAVLDELAALANVTMASDRARIAHRLFESSREHLLEALLESQGGQNVVNAGLQQDVAYAAQLNALNVVAQAVDQPLRIVRA
jgi:2-phosphosulfolactate phosphatase